MRLRATSVSRAEIPRDRVGVVHGDEHGVHVLHRPEDLLSPPDVPGPQEVEQVPTRLADCIGHASQVRRVLDPAVLRRGQLLPRDHRASDTRLRVLLLRILEIAGIPHVGVCGGGGDALVDRGASLAREPLRLLPLAAVEGANRVRTAPDRAPRGRKSPFPGCVLVVEPGANGPGQIVEAHGRRFRLPRPRVVGRRGARRRERCPRRRIHPCRRRSDEPCDFLPRPRTGAQASVRSTAPTEGSGALAARAASCGWGSLPRALIHRRSQT